MHVTTTISFQSQLPGDRPEVRFKDHHPSLTEREAVLEARRCLYCFDAPCQQACPTSIDIASFIRKISTGNTLAAARTILSANINALSCARVCPTQVLCEGACVYNHRDGSQPPIHIGRLQQFAMEAAYAKNAVASLLGDKRASTGKKIALLGAGPASLACAAELTLRGHQCVILEQRALPGGLNTNGVAPYKMKADVGLLEAEMVLGLGVELRTGVTVGKDVKPEDLLAEYDAVFLGVGLGPDGRLAVPGEELAGIIGAVELIDQVKTRGQPLFEGVAHAVVVGGGNTAIDVARELRGLGVPEVTMVYRRGPEHMSAYAHEQDGARHDGVRFLHWHVPVRFNGEGKVSSLTLARTRLEDGRLRNVPGSEADVPCELVAMAVGQGTLKDLCTAFAGVDFRDGHVVVDPDTGATGNAKVFAGGDVANGGKEVVNATAEGKRAALAMDRMLTGA
ncbi:MAG: FAD-dependent oxidoreductase [Deltaproteobacteria bacterium]|nr:FAD-dependent oxidoreductase [Deltaproteobacteria bacterium]